MNLLDIPILSTAIAIVISWALFALFCSYVLEAWVQIKAERGRFMKNYLYAQLMDNSNGINWAEKIYSHGTIDLLSRDSSKPTNDISPALFAQTLIEVVGSAQLVQIRAKELEGAKWIVNYKSKPLNDFKFATQILNPSDLTALFKQAMNSAEVKAFADKETGVVQEAELYRHLVEYFENWFGEFTARLSLWYKKKTRESLFFLGVIIAIIINVDSIQLFSFYEDSPEAKAEVIRYYKEHPEVFVAEHQRQSPSDGKQSTPDGVAGQVVTSVLDSIKQDSASGRELPVSQSNNQEVASNQSALELSHKEVLKSLDSLVVTAKLPVGIKYNMFANWAKIEGWDWFFKFLGVLISGFAASFGAPFWFDVLKKATSKI